MFQKVGAVAHISLDRPQVVNAYNIQMRDDFSEALSAVQLDPEVRALLITGEGRGFCAGADLTEFGSAPSQVIARRVRWERDVWGQLVNLDKPIVAAVHGFCIGSGLEIALLCDLRTAAAGTVFALPEVQLGMIPAAGGTQTLPRVAGGSQAFGLPLTGRRVGGGRGLALGVGVRAGGPQRTLRGGRRYGDRKEPIISGLKRVSKPGLRKYVGSKEIRSIYGGMGVAIISTSQGVMTGSEARRRGIGGEYICYLW